MATRSNRARFPLLLALALALALTARAEEPAAAAPEETAVLTLDVDNFDEVVAKHQFVVVEFYAPWCGQCQKLVPTYEKVAQTLIKHDPPVVLAKFDAIDRTNKPLAARYGIRVYPTLKIFKNYGKRYQDYKGTWEEDAMVQYIKKHIGPPSTEIKSTEDAAALMNDDKQIYIAGVFKEFSGTEFANFLEVAEKLRADYEFGHTLDASHLPRGDAAAEGPLVRLLKPFDELVVDSKDFDVAAIEKFIDDASMPKLATFDNNPDNHRGLLKFFQRSAPKAMVFLNFSTGPVDSFKSTLYAAVEEFKDKEIMFLIGNTDIQGGKRALEMFGVKTEQAPLIAVMHDGSKNKKFFKDHIEADQIVPWLKEYFDGKLTPFMKSQPIPEVNDEPVKVVVADSFQDVVLKSGKNVFVEFYAPWCGHCKKLAPILEEAATTLQSDEEVVIAKMDGTENDVPGEFEVKGYPTMYLVTPSGKVTFYDGERTVDEIVEFIKKNKEASAASESYVKDEL